MSGKDSRASRRRATVLFVEDELSILEEFTKILERDDYRVLSASHPTDVLKIIRKETRIDLAVMDLQLPMEGCSEIGLQEAAGGRRTGLVLGRELRKAFKRIPIIFWSGAYDKEVRPMVLALGNARLVPKAAGPEPVLDLIRDILDIFGSFPAVKEKYAGDPRKFMEDTLLTRIRFYQAQKPFRQAVSRTTGQEKGRNRA